MRTFQALTSKQLEALEAFLPRDAEMEDRVKAACRALAVPYALLSEVTGVKRLRLERIFNRKARATPEELDKILPALGLRRKE
jgi:hypothetical protein